ncbi:hypothetical protein Ciccas_006552, partial [Cichlidogyrus casuarinus]
EIEFRRVPLIPPPPGVGLDLACHLETALRHSLLPLTPQSSIIRTGSKLKKRRRSKNHSALCQSASIDSSQKQKSKNLLSVDSDAVLEKASSVTFSGNESVLGQAEARKGNLLSAADLELRKKKRMTGSLPSVAWEDEMSSNSQASDRSDSDSE